MIGKHGRMRGPGSLTEECEAFLAGGLASLSSAQACGRHPGHGSMRSPTPSWRT